MQKKTLTFIISFCSPLLPILAVLIFNKIGDALPLLVTCAVIFLVILWSMVALIRIAEKSPGMKIIGTLMGIIGIIVTTALGLVSGWASTKI